MAREGLSDKQKEFVRQYLIDFNATQAAIRAGYSEKTARQNGYENLTKPYIQEAIAKRSEELLKGADVTPEKVVKEFALIAFSDINDLVTWDEDHVSFIPSDELPPDKRRIISEIQADINVRTDNEGNIDRTTKLKLKTWNKNQALDKLGQYFKLFTENLNITGKLTVEELKNMSDSELNELLEDSE